MASRSVEFITSVSLGSCHPCLYQPSQLRPGIGIHLPVEVHVDPASGSVLIVA